MKRSVQSVALFLACLSAAQLCLAAPIKIEPAKLTIKESDGTTTDSVQLGFKEKLKNKLRLDHTQKMRIAFKILDSSATSFQPDQAFLRLTSVESGRAAFFAAAFKDQQLEITATSGGIEDQIGTQGGKFEANILLGSTKPDVAKEWNLGAIEVSHRPAPDGNQPPAPQTRLEELSDMKPLITHQHRVPEKRAPAVVSLIFTVITLSPLAAFVLGAARIGANFKGLPTTGLAWIYTIGFHAGIGAILVLYVFFWLGLNLMHTFPIAVVLLAVTLTLGVKAAATQAAPKAVAVEKPTKQE